jgi:hypothetical protein
MHVFRAVSTLRVRSKHSLKSLTYRVASGNVKQIATHLTEIQQLINVYAFR